HLPASILVMLGIGVVAIGATLAVTRQPGLVLPVGGVLLLPAATTAAAAAAMSVIKGPATAPSTGSVFVPPEAAGMMVVYRVAWPPMLCVVSLLPLFAAREANKKGLPIAGPLAAAGVPVAIVATLVVL